MNKEKEDEDDEYADAEKGEFRPENQTVDQTDVVDESDFAA